MRETEEHVYPAAEFHIGGLTILASQTTEADSLRLDEPADTWEVKGTDGELPMGVPLTSNWAGRVEASVWRRTGRERRRRRQGHVLQTSEGVPLFEC